MNFVFSIIRKMKAKLLITLVSFFLVLEVNAQQTAGTSGLLNTPSADFNPDGTFSIGGNFLPQSITPAKFDYNTANYFFNITYFSFFEVTYRATLLKMKLKGQTDRKYCNQDRSVAVRLRALKESKYLPAIVFGANDVLTSRFLTMVDNKTKSNQYFGAIYGVTTKNFSLSENVLGLTLGYSYSDRMPEASGVLGGIRFSPSFYKPLSIITEYDASHFNVGASALLFNHLYLQVFTCEFKDVSAGIAYRGQLPVLKKKK